MIDHIGLKIADAERSRLFYEAALGPLGVGLVMQVTADQTGGITHYGFGKAGKPFFWVDDGGAADEGARKGTHVAFAVDTRAEVDAFHAAALGAGGRDNGPPGLRLDYAPDYYAAFVFDPDGNNVEAVCRAAA
jgi:catechol 2,3-dioxygenase-like lactoylglutathione lyase family enzyme